MTVFGVLRHRRLFLFLSICVFYFVFYYLVMGDILGSIGASAATSALTMPVEVMKIGEQKAAASALQRQQNEFQSLENQKDRDWQQETWLDHFLKENTEYANRLDLQNKIWKSQFDITNAYNDPSAQAARLRAAGFNPSAMMQNSGLASLGQSGASPSASSAAAPNGVPFAGHAVSPASPMSFSGISSTAQMFSSVAQLGDAISRLQQTGLNTERQKAMLGVEVDKAVNEADLTKQKEIMQRIENGVASNWLDKKASAEYQKLINESYAAFTGGDLNKANELVSLAQERLISLQGEIKAAEFPQELANLQELQNVYKSEQEKNRASATASYASAAQSMSQVSLNNALTETENKIRDGRVTAQDLANGLRAVNFALQSRENERDIKTNEAKIFAILEECRRQGLINQQDAAKARLLWKDVGSYAFRTYWQGIVDKVTPNIVVPLQP